MLSSKHVAARMQQHGNTHETAWQSNVTEAVEYAFSDRFEQISPQERSLIEHGCAKTV